MFQRSTLLMMTALSLLAVLLFQRAEAILRAQHGAIDADTQRSRNCLAGMVTPIKLFRLDCGRLPTNDEGLRVLLTRPHAPDLRERWAGPYVRDISMLRDAWGREIHYASNGHDGKENGYRLWSNGRNRVNESGGGDDLLKVVTHDRE
ncbi:MAG: type II secretion system protein GspG [Phycisphaerales bacterium]|nr:type II secretion system protein GspG [Phycisphaerales bacterium]